MSDDVTRWLCEPPLWLTLLALVLGGAGPAQERYRRAMPRSTWTPMRFYPAEGDSAIFELEHSSGLLLEMWLEGINLAAEGTARTTSADAFRNRTSQHRRMAGHPACPLYGCVSPALGLLSFVHCDSRDS
jgi:hypothetical protein